MERYNPKSKAEAINPVAGNLYLAGSIKDLLESGAWIVDDLRSTRERFPRLKLLA